MTEAAADMWARTPKLEQEQEEEERRRRRRRRTRRRRGTASEAAMNAEEKQEARDSDNVEQLRLANVRKKLPGGLRQRAALLIWLIRPA